MSFDYITADEAIHRGGLRLVVVGNVPSGWGESAKGIFHIKRIPFAAVRLVYDNPAFKEWAGQLTGPVAVYEREVPRSGWAEILMLAERLVPEMLKLMESISAELSHDEKVQLKGLLIKLRAGIRAAGERLSHGYVAK